MFYRHEKHLKSIPLGFATSFVGVSFVFGTSNALRWCQGNKLVYTAASLPAIWAWYTGLKRLSGYTREDELAYMYSRYYVMSRNMRIRA